jgi:hypothetical protein
MKLVIFKSLGVFFVCIVLVFIAATGLPWLRFFSILTIVFLSIIVIAIVEHGDVKRSQKPKFNGSLSLLLGRNSEKRRQYRSYMPNVGKKIGKTKIAMIRERRKWDERNTR